jgi:hypothetical protein
MTKKASWSKRLRESLLPKPIRLSAKQEQLLRQLFPNVHWDQVRCVEGMPWFMRHSFAIATALPASYRRGVVYIYFQEYKKEEEDFYTLSTLVHEAFHIQQYHDSQSFGGWGQMGFYRPFMLHYVGWYLSLLWRNWNWGRNKRWSEASYEAYRYHPMEIPAYDYEAAFAEAYWDYYHAPDLEYFLNKHPHLVCRHSGMQVTKRPGWMAWAIATILLSLVVICKPILELMLLLAIALSRPFG